VFFFFFFNFTDVLIYRKINQKMTRER